MRRNRNIEKEKNHIMWIYFKQSTILPFAVSIIVHLSFNGCFFLHAALPPVIRNCKVSNLKASLLSADRGLFEWKLPTPLETYYYKVDGYVTSLSTTDSKALRWHKFINKEEHVIWKNNTLPPRLKAISTNGLPFLSCTDYQISVQAKCLHKINKKKTKMYLGLPVEKTFKGYTSQPFIGVTFDASKNYSLNITLHPSSVISLCRPEYQLEIYKEPVDSVKNCPSLKCLTEVNLKNQTSVLLNASPDNGIAMEQCASYTAVIKLLDPNANGVKQTERFIFDYREENDTDWNVNNFTVKETGPNWVLLTWLSPVNHSECVKNYEIKVHNKEGRLLNSTMLSKRELVLNVSQNFGYIMTPCTKYSFSLYMHGIKTTVNSTITGSTKVIAPGEVINLKVTNVTSTSMSIIWKKPAPSITCANSYALDFTDKFGTLPVVQVDPRDDFFVKYNLKACTNYVIGVQTRGFTLDSRRVTVNVTTLSEVPGAVETFKIKDIDTNVLLLEWTMPAKYPDCVTYYNLSWYNSINQSLVQSLAIEEPGINMYKVTNLQPCWEYTFSIYSGGNIGKSQARNITATMKEQVPGPVQNFMIDSGDFELLAKWQPPNEATHCISNYKIHSRMLNSTDEILIDHNSIKNDKGVFKTFSYAVGEGESNPLNFDPVGVAMKEMKVLSDLIACIDYEVIVTAVSLSGEESPPVRARGTTKPHAFSEPRDGKIIEIGKNWALLEWLVANKSRNRCPLTSFVATCYEPDGTPTIWKTYDHHRDERILINATGLKPYTHYNCTGQAENIAGFSHRSSQLSFLSQHAVPNAPTNVQIVETTNVSVEISWSRPTQIPGYIVEYNVTIIHDGPNYAVPENCLTNITTPAYSYTLPSHTHKYVLEHLLPYQKYLIVVSAATAAGYGPTSKPCTTVTLPSESEVVRNISVSVSYNQTILSWYPPCHSNGIITTFSIELNGSREGFDPDPIQRWNRSYYPNEEIGDMPYEEPLFNLSTEYDYEVTVKVLVKSVDESRPAKIKFQSSAGIPEEPLESSLRYIEPNSKATETSSEQVLITLSKTLFSNKTGRIRFYAILIAQAGVLGPPDSGLLFSENGRSEWPHVRTWANATKGSPVLLYQTTQPWWDPFIGDSLADKVDYIIGSEACSLEEVDSYCNGPLNPSTRYELRIRAFTSVGYMDSQSVFFITDDAFEYMIFFEVGISIFFILMVVILLIFLAFHRFPNPWSSARKKSDQQVCETPADQKCDEFSSLKELPAKKFLVYCNHILNSMDELKAEFQELNTLSLETYSSTIFSCSVAQLPENKKKNRYSNVLPYDMNRVKLDDYNDTDYINASYIKDENCKTVEYIGCQAPKDDTCTEFWNMIYGKVKLIVMLCNLVEQGKSKCYPYFPDENEVLKFDGITINCVQKKIHDSHVERVLSLSKEPEDVCRTIKHFHFVDWPDFGVPSEPQAMLNFCKAVNVASGGSGMIAVHCSAGIGRTGTYIATDLLLRHIELGRSVCVFSTIYKLRGQRSNMVQTEVQYTYIYQCLKHALDNPSLYFKQGQKVFDTKRKRKRHHSRRESRLSQVSSITS